MPAGTLKRIPRGKPKKKSALTKKQKTEVRQLAAQVVHTLAEDINKVTLGENLQLYHNKTYYVSSLLAMEQGTSDDNTATSKTVRKGDRINLRNVNIRFWMSNKDDRPNVMYKGILFWYEAGTTLSDALVYFTQQNKMLDRYNTEQIRIADTFIVKSTNNYAVDANNHEKSYLATLNKSYKRKFIHYNENGTVPKGWDLGFALVCYDAYGTLQTDNISSFAFNYKLTFEDL